MLLVSFDSYIRLDTVVFGVTMYEQEIVRIRCIVYQNRSLLYMLLGDYVRQNLAVRSHHSSARIIRGGFERKHSKQSLGAPKGLCMLN